MIAVTRHIRIGFRLLALVAAASLVSGCAVNPVSEALTRAINLNGHALYDEYEEANVVGFVVEDEKYVGQYHRILRNALHVQGARPGAVENRYRIVPIAIRESDLIRHHFPTGAIVPDHLPPLIAGDIVEFLNPSGFDAFRGFAATKRGSGIVLNVICYKDDPAFDECTKTRSPWKGWGWNKEPGGVGPSPYLEDTAAYGFDFSERYDDDGRLLPGSPTLPRRPFR